MYKHFTKTVIILFFPIFTFAQFGPEKIILQRDLPAYGFIGDLNGDGNQDLISSMNKTNKIVWFNNGNGLGDFVEEYQTISSDVVDVSSLSGVDIDGDGDLDILSSSTGDQKIAWYENLNSLGNFSSQKIIAEGIGEATYVSHSDIDGNGTEDIIFSSSGSGGQIMWYSNTSGQGDFIPMQTITTGDCNAVATLDMDGDGDQDIIFGDLKFRWSENLDGLGNFGTPEIISNGQTHFVKPVDLDGDGWEDFAVHKRSGTTVKLVWYKNVNGSGDFLETVLNSAYLSGTIEISDVDQDGNMDLISASKGQTILHKNTSGQGPTGNGTTLNELTSNSIYLTPGYTSAAVGDIDNDNDLDIIGLAGEETYIHIFSNSNGQGIYNESEFHGTKRAAGHAQSLADINGDGKLDVLCEITKGDYDVSEIAWLEYDYGLETFTAPQIIYSPNTEVNSLVTSDINNDNNLDILYSDFDYLYWLRGTGLGFFDDPIIIGSVLNGNPTGLYTSDLDNDGDLDVLTFDHGDTIGWYSNLDGLGTFSSINTIDPSANDFINNLGVMDVDGDDDLDVLVAVNFNDRIGWYENLDGLGNFGFQQILTTEVNDPRIVIADIDNDGDDDILTPASLSDGNIRWFENQDGLGINSQPIIIAELTGGGRSMSISDLDNDLDLDIMTISTATNQAVWYENLNNEFSDAQSIQGDWDILQTVSAGKIDDDNLPDIFTGSGEDGKISWHHSFFGDNQVVVNCFYDENENGIFDPNEIRLQNQQVYLEEESIANWSTGDGQILFHLDTGDYTFYYISNGFWNNTNSAVANVSVTNLEEEVQVNFGLTPIFPLYETISALYTIGDTKCGYVVAFGLGILNTGTFTTDGFVVLEVDPIINYNSAFPSPDSISGNKLFWNYENLQPTEVKGIYLTMIIPGVDYIGEEIEMELLSYIVDGVDTTLTDTYDYSSTIICSYDPNDKIVSPDRPGDENYTLFDEYLEYTIRFQNTGNATADNVRIDDNLDSNLDWSTFQPILASHSYEVTLNDSGKLSYFFENIQLPDSTANQLESNGFFSYKIKPKQGIPENTVIENHAEIYFDYNPAIITNTVQNTLVPILVSFTEIDLPCSVGQNGAILLNNILATEPYQFLWSNGSTDSSLVNIEKGSYSLTITDGNNVEYFYDFIIDAPDEIFSNIASTAETNGSNNGVASVNPSGGISPYSYLWGTNPLQTTSTINGLNAGIYQVTITDSNACSVTDSILVESISGIDNIINLVHFDVFPNPSNSNIQLKLSLNQLADFTVSFTNVTGYEVERYDFTNTKELVKNIKFDDFPRGIYFIKIILYGKVYVKKLILI